MRKKILPSNPKSWQKALGQLSKLNIQTNKNENICFIVHNLIFLTCAKNLEFLISNCEIMLADSTFYASLLHLYQLYTVHNFKNGFFFKFVFCFLPDKSAETYTEMFTAVQKLWEGKFKLRLVLLDFARVALIAAAAVFLNIVIKCCQFHLGHNLLKKIA